MKSFKNKLRQVFSGYVRKWISNNEIIYLPVIDAQGNMKVNSLKVASLTASQFIATDANKKMVSVSSFRYPLTGDNYVSIEADGTIKVNGTATVFEDLNFDPARSGGPVATRPDDVTINNCIYKEFTSANNQLCGDSQEIPHKAKLSVNLYGHLHCFLKTGESAGTTGVTFTVYWSLRQSTGLTTGNFTLSATSAELTANPNRFDIYDSIGFGVAEKGAQLGLALYRTAGDAGDVIVTTYGIQYEIDTVGSRTLTTK